MQLKNTRKDGVIAEGEKQEDQLLMDLQRACSGATDALSPAAPAGLIRGLGPLPAFES